MAVAILEKSIEALQKNEDSREIKLNRVYDANAISDEQHNAKIGETYARLINPNAKIDEILGRAETEIAPARKELFVERPYLVENARADAAIFRADNPLNRKVLEVQPAVVAKQETEEDNEDLRPTQTTIQYKTAGVKKQVEESKTLNSNAEKRESLSKKEKIVIAVIVGIVIAMFALIIINSAILSGINSEMSALQSTLTTVKTNYAEVSDDVLKLVSDVYENAENLAQNMGLVK